VKCASLYLRRVKDDKEIDHLWAYLKQFDAQGDVKNGRLSFP
jgi:hypothetical protein